MKNYKIVAYIIVSLLIIGGAIKFYRWVNPDTHTATVSTPTDTSFSQVTHDTYRPPSIPIIEKKQKPPAKLPSNVKPEDVKEVITIVKNPQDTTRVIITNDNEVYIDRQNGKVESVTVTTYKPPILEWGLFPKIGVSSDDKKPSPMVGISFLRVLGRVDVPVFALDIYGIGLGADVQVFKPISIGVLYHSAWDTHKSIRLTVAWNF
jgi:hypothetical protein